MASFYTTSIASFAAPDLESGAIEVRISESASPQGLRCVKPRLMQSSGIFFSD